MSFTPVMPKSQLDSLLDHFKVTPNISAMEAHNMYKIRSLSKRVCELRALGYELMAQRRFDATGQRYVRYHFVPQRAA